MTDNHSTDATDGRLVDAVTDPTTLRDNPDVPFHEETDVVDEETLQTVAGLDDLAPVGVVNDDGEVLFLRVTDDCELKIPSAAVPTDAPFGPTAREWIRDQAGIEVELDGPHGVWHFEVRLADGERTAERYFVLFGATPVGETSEAADAAAVEWAATLPDGAVEAPGTRQFFE